MSRAPGRVLRLRLVPRRPWAKVRSRPSPNSRSLSTSGPFRQPREVALLSSVPIGRGVSALLCVARSSPSTWDEAARPESLAVCCARAETPAAPPCSSIRSGLGRGCWSSSSAPYVSPQRISVEGRALHRFWRPESSPSRGRVFVASSVVCSIGTAAEVGAFVGSEHLGVPGRPSTPRPDSGASRIRVALQESPPERRIAGPSTASKRSR